MATFKVQQIEGDYVNCEVTLDSGQTLVLPVYGEDRHTLEGMSDQLDKKIAALPKNAPPAKEVMDALRDKAVKTVVAKPIDVEVSI